MGRLEWVDEVQCVLVNDGIGDGIDDGIGDGINDVTDDGIDDGIYDRLITSDITSVSNTLYNRTSWTSKHALSSDNLPIITTINIRHQYRLQTQTQLQESQLDTIHDGH